jgi:small GTP-binding protein
MAWNRKITAILLLAGLAVAGYQLRSFVPNVLAEYQQAASFHPAWGYVYIGVAAVSGLAFVALIVWALWALISNTRAKDRRRETAKLTPGQMSARQRREEIESQLGEGQSLAEDAELPAELREPIRRSLEQLKTKLDKQRLEIVAFGTVSSGKSALLNALAGREVFKSEVRGGTTVARNEIPWPGADQVILVDTPGLAEIKGADREELAKRAARDADLVLFVTDGPLKEFEHQFLEHLAAMEKPVLVCLNKEDWFLPEDRDRLLAQIAEHLEGLVPAENIVALRAQPAARGGPPGGGPRPHARLARRHAVRRVGRSRARHSRAGRPHARDRQARRPRPAAGQSTFAIARARGRSQGSTANRAGQAGA